MSLITVNDVFLPYLDNQDRYLILRGGAGSGKSVFASQKWFNRITTEEGHCLLFAHKLKDKIETTVFNEFKKRISEAGIQDEFKVNKQKHSFIHEPTGNQILTTGLDDEEKIKSITGEDVNITGIWIEEANLTQESDFDQLDARMRGISANYKQMILTFNPTDERSWLRKRFFPDGHEEDRSYSWQYTTKIMFMGVEEEVTLTVSYLSTTIEDNLFATREDHAVLETKAAISPNFYRIYKLGKWGRADVQRPYVYNFDYDKHISDKAIKRKLPIYFSIDFNLEPLVCTCHHIWFDKFGHHWHTFKEIVLKIGSVEEFCEQIQTMFEPHELANAFWSGDATGTKRNVVHKNNITAWQMLDSKLRLGRRLHVPRINPLVEDNRHLVNAIYALHPDRKIHSDCKLLINELQYTEADPEGKILKKDRSKLEQRADALDTDRYAANTWLSDFITHQAKYIKKVA